MSLVLSWDTEVSKLLPEGGEALDEVTQTLELDIISSDVYNTEAEISDHAVEQGVDITDHTEPKKDRATVEAAISERITSINQVAGSSFQSVSLKNGVKATALVAPEGTARRADAFETLRELNRNGTLVNVEGLIRPLENYQVESVSAPRDVSEAGLLNVSIVFVEHRTAEVEEVDAPAPRVERGRSQRDTGRQSAVIGAGEAGPGVNPTAGAGIGAGATVLDPAGTSTRASEEDVSDDPDDRSTSVSTLRNARYGGSSSTS